MITAGDPGQCRLQLQKVLDSSELAGARQLREFLEYVGEAAISGRSHIDQVEIARAVLNRTDDFNPIDDSSVRKIGSLVRQRLEKYYATEGVLDPIVISLPVRSYVPLFRQRDGHAPEPAVAEPLALKVPDQPVRRAFPWLAASAALAAFGAGYLTRQMWPRADTAAAEYDLPTVKGDILHKVLDLPGPAIRLGPELGPYGDMAAQLRFSPDQPAQQAGLLLFQDPDNYVRFARHFASRTLFEFGAETGGVYAKPPGTFSFDPSGQDGRPVWLSLRRNGATVEAFHSPDGELWQRVGGPLQLQDPLARARPAVYANRGRSDSREVVAHFDHFAHGLIFHDLPDGPIDPATFPGWNFQLKCPEGTQTGIEKSTLVFDLRGSGPCSMDLARPVPSGDWVLKTKMDFVPVGGSVAGIFVAGEKGLARLIRWDVGGGSLTAEHVGHRQINRRDYEGRPPVVLCLEAAAGRLNARYTRDGITFERVPLDVPLTDIGSKLVAGVQAGLSTWSTGYSGSQARFSYILEEIHGAKPFR